MSATQRWNFAHKAKAAYLNQLVYFVYFEWEVNFLPSDIKGRVFQGSKRYISVYKLGEGTEVRLGKLELLMTVLDFSAICKCKLNN